MDTIQTAPETFTVIILLGLLAVILDAGVRRSHRHAPGGPAQAAPT
jgi:hypothetical protein